ncbi:MAG: alanine--glyoxylate aminotransferase family protein [Candidatus Sericytochromatia bacterium]|nr:alanine--glyoxylate aminotransferase family protein [Candidatus Sericytochromatia bacterium]
MNEHMREHMRLMLPGPTPIPPGVSQVLGRPMINHRGPEFGAMYRACIDGIRWLFQTEGDVLLLGASSGTGGLEAAVSNVLSAGDQVLALVAGEFGARFADMAERFGGKVTRMSVEYGEAFAPEAIEAALATGAFKVLLVTHNETSTAVMQPLEAIARAARRANPDILILVDAVSSLGVVPLPVDAWDLDIVVTGSQKAFMIPPGLAMASVSARAWKAHETATAPRYYFDFTQHKQFDAKNQTPWTPALPQIYGLYEAFGIMRGEGLDALFERHETMTRMLRAGLAALGLHPVVTRDDIASRSVTAVYPPAGIDAEQLRKAVQEQFGLVLAGGQGKMAGKIFRIGHLGFYQPLDMLTVLAALEVVCHRLGAAVPLGAGVRAAQASLLGVGERETATRV